jgi:hypothetical protein
MVSKPEKGKKVIKKDTPKKKPVEKKQVLTPARSNGKHPGGAPSKYNPKWIEILPSLFENGQSVVEVSTELQISVAAYYLYEKEHPEFLEASTRGKQISQSWWERQGRENLFDESSYDGETKDSTSKRFNDRLWSKNVSCRFRKDWTDKQEIEHSGKIDLTIDNDDAALK